MKGIDCVRRVTTEMVKMKMIGSICEAMIFKGFSLFFNESISKIGAEHQIFAGYCLLPSSDKKKKHLFVDLKKNYII